MTSQCHNCPAPGKHAHTAHIGGPGPRDQEVPADTSQTPGQRNAKSFDAIKEFRDSLFAGVSDMTDPSS